MTANWTRRSFGAAMGALTIMSGFRRKEAAAQAVEGKLRIVRTIRETSVGRVAWSPDGQHIAMSLASGTNPGYAIWDARTGRKLRDLHGTYGQIGGGSQLLFTPDGKHLIVEPRLPGRLNPESTSLALWNVETGAIDHRIAGPALVRNYAVAVQGQRCAVRYPDRSVFTYETRTWQQLAKFQHDAALAAGGTAFAISPDGEKIAVGGSDGGGYKGDPYGRISIHDAASGVLLKQVTDAHEDSVQFLSFLGDATRIVSVASQDQGRDDDPVRIWDANTGHKSESIVANFGVARSLVSTSDGRLIALASGSRGSWVPPTFRIWDVRSHQQVGALIGDGTYFGAAVFSPDGREAAIQHIRVRGSALGVLVAAVA